MINELRTKKTQLMLDAQKLALNLTNENRGAFDALMNEVDSVEGDIARHKRVAKLDSEIRAMGKPARGAINTPGSLSNDPLENAQLQKQALRDYMVSGKETRDLGVGPVAGNITGGSQLIAPAFYPILTQAMQTYGGVVNIVDQFTTDTGASMKTSFSNDVGNDLVTWNEDTAATKVDPILSTAQSTTEMYTTGALLVTLEEIQDSYWSIDNFINNIFGERLYRGLAKRISLGSTSGAFASYLSGAVSAGTSASLAAGFKWGDIANLYGSVDPIYASQGTWTMPLSVRKELIGTVDTLGRPVYLISPTDSGPIESIMGLPVVLDPYLADPVAGSKSLVFGNFKAGHTLRQVGGFQIARDPYTYLTSNGAVAFIGYGRGGSFAKNAGTNPIKYLTTAAS